jgi:hypothetical protein
LCAGHSGGIWKTIDCRTIGFNTCAMPPATGQAACQ